MEQKTLNISIRERVGKGPTKKLRDSGKIPAIIYGHKEPVPVVVDSHEFNTKFHTVSENTIINLLADKSKYDVLVKDYQENIMTGDILHIDFYEIDPDHTLHTSVPIVLEGVAVGVREGGVMDQQLHAVEVECLPSDIPEIITVNIEEMEVGSVLHVSDLPEFAGVKYLTISQQVVISITAPHIEEEPEVEEEEGEELLEGEEGEEGVSEETEEGAETEAEE